MHVPMTFYNAPIRCLNLWFESGDVVVAAGLVAFRVHRDVLSDNSTVLADMLSSLAAREDGDGDDEELDGCPVVRLEDSVHDVKHLLCMAPDATPSRDDDIEPVPSAECADLASEARMAHKYKLHVRKEAYCALRHRFPSTFAEWEARERERLSASDAIEAISLFRAIGDDDSTTAHMLVLLYLACTLPHRALLRGARRRDGVLETLRSEDVERCVLLKEALLERSAWMAARLFDGEASADCRGAEGVCDARIAETRSAIVYGEGDEWMHADALGESMRSWIDSMELEKGRGMCEVCAGMLCEKDRELRRELWEEMPSLLARVEAETRRARGGHDEEDE